MKNNNQAQPTLDSLLRLMHKKGAVKYGNFTLSSGQESDCYFDGRLISLNPEGAWQLGQLLLQLILESGLVVSAVGGPTLGADPLVTAVAMASWQRSTPLPAFIIRQSAKSHGLKKIIAGPVPAPKTTVAIVDDTYTTGQSLLWAIAAVEEIGCQVGLVAVMMDRSGDNGQVVRERGYKFLSLFSMTENGEIIPT